MPIYYLDEALRDAHLSATQEKAGLRGLTESQQRAVELLKNSLKGSVVLGGVQGPPGTGKTSIVEANTRVLVDEALHARENTLVVYVAPTNHLVHEAFRRVARQLFMEGISPREIVESVRVYGSRIKPWSGKEGSLKLGNTALRREDLERLVSRVPEPSNDFAPVRLVFATEYQRVSPRLPKGEVYGAIRYIVDEASRSPFYRVFITLAQKLVRQPEAYFPKSMVVLGDPKQAIAVQEELKIYKVPLLMDYVKSRLERLKLKDKYYVFLDTTFRLPGPTEEPISRGFYEGRLKAYERFEKRFRKIARFLGGETLNIAKKKLANAGVDLADSRAKQVLNAIDEALGAGDPILVFKTERFPPGETFHPKRARIGYVASMYLNIILNIVEEGVRNVAVTAPYSDITSSIGYWARKSLRRLGKQYEYTLRYSTVHGIIGGEAEAIVTVLGKEWTSNKELRTRYIDYDNYYSTIYFREPQVLNVQMSRHKLLLVVIGDIDGLETQARTLHHSLKRHDYSWIHKTMKAINDLTQRGKALKVETPQ